MSERPPLDLRALGDVDSPEVVREALRRFRRRIVTRYVWLALAIVVFGAAVIWGRTPTTLQERIDQASAYVAANPIWRVPGASVALERATGLGDDHIGFHFVVIGRNVNLRMTGQVSAESVYPFDRYIEIERPSGGRATLIVSIHGRRWPIPLGPGSGVPQGVWRL
jgi:hypothetical protein